nr:acyltransferase family protein [Nocardioides luti]
MQGIRGLGVILVVVGHLAQWPPGAFAMLDMFFVLSGFLITGILIAAFPRYGPGFFVVFYLARFRRLIPAAVAVIAVTVAAWYLLFNSTIGALTARDGVWALLLAVNWHFASNGTDYFADQRPSPLLHYWSLSVEEQFYAVWPLLIFLVLLAWHRHAGRRTAHPDPERVLLVVLGLVTAGMFAYSCWHSAAAPRTAYFSTLDRSWEFGIGALLAVLAPRLARMPAWTSRRLGWGGAVGLIALLFVPPGGLAFPAPWGLGPALTTAVIIAGGIDRDTRYLRIIDNRPMVYLGDISYSVYLVHLPVNLALRPWFEPGAPAYYASTVALTVVASLACFYLVEQPLRFAPALMTAPERRRRAGRPRRGASPRVLQLGWLGVSLVVAAALMAASLHSAPAPASASSERAAAAPSGGHAVTLLERQQERLIDALAAPDFPDFDPPLGALSLEQWSHEEAADGCVDVSEAEVASCRFARPAATKLAVVVGDSFAIAWMPGIRAALEPRGWAVQQLTLAACPTWTLSSYLTPEGKPFEDCAEHHALVESLVQQQHPDLVVLASGGGEVRNSERPDMPHDGFVVAQQGLAATLASMPIARTVVLAPSPPHADLVACIHRFGVPQDCTSSPDADWYDHVDGETAATAAAGARYVQTRDWFCVADVCPGFVGRTPVTADGSHLTVEFSEQLAPLLRRALIGPG